MTQTETTPPAWRKVRVKAAIVAAALVLGGVALIGPPAQAGTIVGGISVQTYCRAHYGSTANAVVRYNTVYGWWCATPSGDRGFYAEQACLQQYPQYKGRVHAAYADYHNPYTWFCYSY
ncbi:hypothetical protein [Leifsonia sp. TF02-11]|uniref:hypothetical protein n=1 Tax=Leifsonia sp. TF02-11 TaxID=2815212 RepID=UPI001AA15332|nr:hypothetical protein [Leifsonia sp. TF02-11]MBO1739029.1 hypothetical protein [Leifsonia sp. TF02-11]